MSLSWTAPFELVLTTSVNNYWWKNQAAKAVWDNGLSHLGEQGNQEMKFLKGENNNEQNEAQIVGYDCCCNQFIDISSLGMFVVMMA